MFSKRLKEIRLFNNLTQQAIADILGVARASISKYEAGISEPTIDTLIKVAKYFDVSIDYLLGNSNIPSISNSENKTDLSTALNLINIGASVLTREKQDMLANLLKAIYVSFMDSTSNILKK
jgi:transcriptional regulator with XRE-family HTH domain